MGLKHLKFDVTLTEINCGKCGGTYAINERYREQCQESGSSWHCPYCQIGWGYSGNSDNEKLKRKLEQKERQLDRQKKRTEWAKQDAKNANNRARAEKAAKTRLKNRIKSGTCPCCKRHFKQLHAHMQNKHPEYNQNK